MRIERIRVQNFKMFANATLDGIAPYSVLVGANGVGKSTFFDIFGFLRDCLKDNVRTALIRRGGFKEVISRGHETEEIEIELKLRMELSFGPRTVTYFIALRNDPQGPVVAKENLKYTRFGGGGKPFEFIKFENGQGSAIRNEAELEKDTPEGGAERETQRLDSPDILAIKGLGQFERFEAATQFRKLIENWHVSDFHIGAARGSPDAGYAEHLSAQGDNLALVTQFLYERHKKIFDIIIQKMERRVPGVSRVDAEQTLDGRIVLRFQDGSFKDPFVARNVSDGTIKMFAYLVLLHDPQPHPLLCVEEPENQLYPTLLQQLSEEFADYAKRGGQVFVSTHSPDFLNAVPLSSIFIMTKANGYTSVRKASEFQNAKEFYDAGDPPGTLWRQRIFYEADPK